MSKAKVLLALAMMVGSLCLGQAAHAQVLLVDDFDDVSKPNLLGGNFGAWNKDLDDTTQSCVDGFEGDIKHGTRGHSLKLDYDVDSPNPAYNGFWMDLVNSDLRSYNSLVFWVKGDAGSGFTTQFKMEIKSAKNSEIGRHLVTGVSSEWKQIVVPFRKINGITDWSNMKEIVIVFDDINSTDKDGIIYIDDISFQSL